MAIDIDGTAVLRAIIENPAAFPDVGAELNAVARKLVLKQLKAKTTSLELLRKIHSAIGVDPFALILDDLGNSGGTSLAKKIDKENSHLPVGELECRKHVALLASGAATPATKEPKPATRAPKSAPEMKSTKSKKAALSQEQKDLASALKAKTTNLTTARDLWRAAGDAEFELVLGNLSLRPIQSLAKRLDSANPDIAASSVDALRDRIADLVSGRADPVFRDIMASKSMATVGQRKMK